MLPLSQKRKQPVERDPQDELIDKDFKVTIMSVFMDLMNRWKSQLSNRNYKNESNGNSRTENYLKIRNKELT